MKSCIRCQKRSWVSDWRNCEGRRVGGWRRGGRMRRGLMRTVLTKALNTSEPATPGTWVVPKVTSKARILMSASDRRRWLKNPVAVSVNRCRSLKLQPHPHDDDSRILKNIMRNRLVSVGDPMFRNFAHLTAN